MPAKQGEKPSGGGIFGGGPATSAAAQRDGKASGGGVFGGGPAVPTTAQREVKPYGGGLFGQASPVVPTQEGVKPSVGGLFGRGPAMTTTDQQRTTMPGEGGLSGATPTSTYTGGGFGAAVTISTHTGGISGAAATTSTQKAGLFGRAANTVTPAVQQGTTSPPKGGYLGGAADTKAPVQQQENLFGTGLVGGGNTTATQSQRNETSSGAGASGGLPTTAPVQQEATMTSGNSKTSALSSNSTITSPSKSLESANLPDSPADVMSVVPMSDPVDTQGEQDLKPSYQFNADNLVTLLVGPEQQKMVVHKSFMTQTSEFFESALKHGLSEGETYTIKLTAETPELMAHYLDWVYTTELPSGKTAFFSTTTDQKVAAYNLLAELYVLGERRLDSAFRNAVTAEIVRLRPSQFGLHDCQLFQQGKMVKTIYQSTPTGSPARRLMIDLSLKFGCPQCHTEILDKAFLLDLTQALFVAGQSAKGLEGKRELELRAEDYCI